MDERIRSKIWKNPTNKNIDGLIEEGIEILKQGTQKSLKDFDSYIRDVIGEEEIIR